MEVRTTSLALCILGILSMVSAAQQSNKRCKELIQKGISTTECNVKESRGLTTLSVYCNCLNCSDPNPEVCTAGGINTVATKETKGCSYGTCVPCTLYRNACSKTSICCDGAVAKTAVLQDRSSLKGYCDMLSKSSPPKCRYCAPKNQVCGKKKQAIPCCDNLNEPNSKTRCLRLRDEFRCTDDPCKGGSVGTVTASYSCPGVDPKFQFCKCPPFAGPTGPIYNQCVYDGTALTCTPCSLPGGSCTNNSGCCQESPADPFNPRQYTKNQCLNKKCQKCFSDGGRQQDDFNCHLNKTTPCCTDFTDPNDITVSHCDPLPLPSGGYECL